jgi:hypothetical protein
VAGSKGAVDGKAAHDVTVVGGRASKALKRRAIFSTLPVVLQRPFVRLRKVKLPLSLSAGSFPIRGRRRRVSQQTLGKTLNLSNSLSPLISLIAGILILVIPRLLNYIVAIYLIIIGLIGLFGSGSLRL